jgi:hypothetical protein
MRRRFLSSPAHQWVISVLLVALGVRALVPVGFMPSSERPFTLEICPDGFPSQLLHGSASPAPQGLDAPMAAHHHHHDGAAASGDAAPAAHHSGHGQHEQGARAEHCVFAAAASAGPAPHILLAVASIVALATPAFDVLTPVPEHQRFRVQQPRAPPALS